MAITGEAAARYWQRAQAFCPRGPTFADIWFGGHADPDCSGVLLRGIVPCDRYQWLCAALDVKDWGWLL